MSVGHEKRIPDTGAKSRDMIEPAIGIANPQGGDPDFDSYSDAEKELKEFYKNEKRSLSAAACMLVEEKIVRLLSEGANVKEIASVLGLTTPYVIRYVRRPRLLKRLYNFNKEAFDNLQEEYKASKEAITERLEEASLLALEELIELATGSKSDVVRYKASQDILDRNPTVSRTKRLEGGAVSNTFMNSQVLMQMAAVARELDAVHGNGVATTKPNVSLSPVQPVQGAIVQGAPVHDGQVLSDRNEVAKVETVRGGQVTCVMVGNEVALSENEHGGQVQDALVQSTDNEVATTNAKPIT